MTKDNSQNNSSDIISEDDFIVKSNYLNFKPYQPDWQKKDDAQEICREITNNFENSPAPIKYLALICDNAALGLYLKQALMDYYGQSFFALRDLRDDMRSPKSFLEYPPHEIAKKISGYHHLARPLNLQKVDELISLLDWDTRELANFNLERIEKYLRQDGYFTPHDIYSVSRFGTALVFFINQPAWKKYLLRSGNLFAKNHISLYSPHNLIIYVPEDFMDLADPPSNLRHQYSHLLDFRFKQARLWGDGRLHLDPKEIALDTYKAELSGYLASEEKFDPFIQFGAMESHMNYLYPDLLKDESNRQRLAKFIALIRATKPFFLSFTDSLGFNLKKESPLNHVFRTFLSALPTNDIVYKILESIPLTGLFLTGQKRLAKQ